MAHFVKIIYKERGTKIIKWRAWEESNLRIRLRRPALYPLSYRRTKKWGE
jgi:hypothetical protein